MTVMDVNSIVEKNLICFVFSGVEFVIKYNMPVEC